MAEWQDTKLTPLQDHIKVQLHLEQLLLILTWTLAEQLFYNQGCNE